MYIKNYKLLAEQIINQAIADLKNIKPRKKVLDEKQRIKDREDAKRFLYSEWFKELCEELNIASEAILKKYQKYIDLGEKTK